MKRSHHVGFVDANSDEGIEIDVSAAVTLEGMQIAHHPFPVKHPWTDEQAKPSLTSAIPPITASISEGVDANTNGNPGEEKKRNQVWLFVNHGVSKSNT